MNLLVLLMGIVVRDHAGLTSEISLSLYDVCNCSSDKLMSTLNTKSERKTDAVQSDSLFGAYPSILCLSLNYQWRNQNQ